MSELRLSRASARSAAHLRNRRRAGPRHRDHRRAAGRRRDEDPGAGAEFVARLTTVDVWTGEIRQLAPPSRDPRCVCCGLRDFVYLDGSRRAPSACAAATRCRFTNAPGRSIWPIWRARLGELAPVRSNEFALRVTIDAYELTVFPDGRAIIKGTTDIGIARSLYARYVGA